MQPEASCVMCSVETRNRLQAAAAGAPGGLGGAARLRVLVPLTYFCSFQGVRTGGKSHPDFPRLLADTPTTDLSFIITRVTNKFMAAVYMKRHIIQSDCL